MMLDSTSIELLTMRQLVVATGVPRSTIQFYIREDLLPAPQRLANNRAIYGRVHVDLLEQIRRLKAEGLSLEEIKPLVKEVAGASTFYQVDVAEAVDSATKARILEAAANQFGRKGYQRTRLSDIIRQAGVTPQVLASHFASKKRLFAESFGIASTKVMERAIAAMERESDPRRKLLNSFSKLLRSRQVPDPTLWALARAEALYEGGEPATMAQQAYRTMSSLHASELTRLREASPRDDRWPPVSDELMAYCFLGAEEYLTMRLAWDERFTHEDALKAYLLLIAAVHAQYDERLDVRERWDGDMEAVRGLTRQRGTT
jgi:AcrR family transcriptional regulator/predicted DNA-binding transcriptional regulator AlpA